MTGCIVNPAAGRGRAGRLWPRMAPRLREYFSPLEVRLTSRPGDTALLARELLDRGAARILVVGGDGTVHEAVNSGCPVIGVLPAGSAGDFARALGVPRAWEAAIPWLAAADTVPVDLGSATFLDPSGAPAIRRFVNMASFGLGARAAAHCGLPYLVAAIAELARSRPAAFDLTLDGQRSTLRAAHVAIGNGCCQGNGMLLCPRARLDDGFLDVTVIEPVSLLELALNLPKVYSGALLEHPKVHARRVRKLEARAAVHVPVELDGEPVGRLPLEMEVIPRAVRVLRKA